MNAKSVGRSCAAPFRSHLQVVISLSRLLNSVIGLFGLSSMKKLVGLDRLGPSRSVRDPRLDAAIGSAGTGTRRMVFLLGALFLAAASEAALRLFPRDKSVAPLPDGMDGRMMPSDGKMSESGRAADAGPAVEDATD